MSKGSMPEGLAKFMAEKKAGQPPAAKVSGELKAKAPEVVKKGAKVPYTAMVPASVKRRDMRK